MERSDDTTVDQAGPDLRWHDRVPTWVMVAVPVAVVALVVAGLLAGRSDPQPPASGAGPQSNGEAPGITPPAAQACLGGDTDLNQAARYAHEHAALTEAGAAEFTATVMRWTYAAPRPGSPEEDAATAALVLDGQTQPQSSLSEPSRWLLFTPGEYLVDGFDPVAGTATVYAFGVLNTSAVEGGSAQQEPSLNRADLRTRDGHWILRIVERPYPRAHGDHFKQNYDRVRQFQGSC